MNNPNELWIVFNNSSGDRIYRSKERAFSRWKRDCERAKGWDSAEDYKKATKPQRYLMAVRAD